MARRQGISRIVAVLVLGVLLAAACASAPKEATRPTTTAARSESETEAEREAEAERGGKSEAELEREREGKTDKGGSEAEHEAERAKLAEEIERHGYKTEPKAIHHDTSPPLRTIKPLVDAPGGGEGEEGGTREEFLPRPKATTKADTALQADGPTRAAPTVGTAFDGVGQGFSGPAGTFTVNSAPPDTNSAVGTTQVVEIVNSSFAVFNKATGAATYGPAATNTLFSGFGGGCQANNDGDGVVRFDRAANRWVVTQFSVTTTPFLECTAVSATADATGAWYRYSFQYTDFPDYPKLSVWPDAYYVTFNMFNAAGTAYLGAKSCAMDRSKMLAGLAATQQCFDTSTSYGGLLPADLDSAAAPPAGAPNVQFALGTTATTIAYWKFHVDWTTPANSTFTGPTTISVAAYNEACSGGTCIPQPGTAQKLDSLADRAMFRLAYRNFGDHEALLFTHSVVAGSSTGIRWYEVRLPGGTPSLFQQGTYAPDANYRWMGSAAFDKAGNIGVAYSISSSTVSPGLRATGRLAGDTPGTMTQAEATLVNGAGSQSSRSLTRWGDYASLSIDPSDDCTFWFASEYLPGNGAFNWRTYNSSFQLPGCSTFVANDFSITAAPTSGHVLPGTQVQTTVTTASTAGSPESVAMSVSGLPSGVSGSFSPSTVSAGGSSTLTLTALGTAAAGGPTNLTITGTAPSATHTTTYALTVDPATTAPGAPTIGAVTGGNGTATVSWTAPASDGGSPITGYVVTPYIGATAQTAQTFASTATTQTLTGLTNGTTYTFTVAAKNVVGTGAASAASAALVVGTVPSNPGFQSAVPGNASAKVGYIAGASNGGPITGYVVTPYIGGVAQAPQTFANANSSQTVVGLTNGTTYTFKVAAKNAVGTGPQSNATPAIVVGSPVAPAAPTAASGDASAKVTWKAPANNGSAVTGYVVTPYLGATAKPAQTFASTALTQTVTGLANGSTYTFKVAAINANGTGPQSAASAALLVGLPAAPALQSAGPLDASAKVTWYPPTGNGSPLTGSVITPYVGGVAQAAQTFGPGNSQVVTGLTNGTTYTFKIAAKNAVGTGPQSGATAAVLVGTPSAPTIGAPAPGDGAATVKWTAPAANGSPITGYTVTPFVGATAQAPQTFASTATSQVLAGLANGTAYTFKVAATNGVGTGPLSAASASIVVGAPVAPQLQKAVPGDGTAKVSWYPPATNGSPVTGYVITPYIGSVAQAPQSFGTSNTQTVTGLTNGTTYTFKIAATNARGTGPASAATNAITAGTPAAPTGQAAVAGNGQATVSWIAPSGNGSPVTGYVVTPYVGSTAKPAQTFPSTATSQAVTGLVNGTAYTFKVAAINAVGTGLQSAATAAVTPSGAGPIRAGRAPSGRSVRTAV